MSEPHPTITGTCPCGLANQFFGPATIIFIDADASETEVQYVNCRRCGAMLLVGRDVEEVRRGV